MSTSPSPAARSSPPPRDGDGRADPPPWDDASMPSTPEGGWPSFRRYARVVYRRPFENLRDLWRLRRHVAHPLRALTERHYRGRPYLGTLEFRDGPVIRYRVGTTDRHIAWTTFLRDDYRIGRLPTDRRLGCVVDIGAQIGTFAARIAGKAERVLAFEPVPSNAALLRRNVEAFPHVEVIEAAVADREGTLTLHLSEDNTGGHSAYRAAGRDEGRAVTVRCVPLRATLERDGLDRIQALAMEYHELAPGAAPTTTGVQLVALLERNGFAVEVVPDSDRTGMIHARRR